MASSASRRMGGGMTLAKDGDDDAPCSAPSRAAFSSWSWGAAFKTTAGDILLIAAADFWGGFVLSILWGWFAVSHLGLPSIGVAAAAGLLVVGRLFFFRPLRRFDGQDAAEALADATLLPAVLLGAGWLLHVFAGSGRFADASGAVVGALHGAGRVLTGL